MEKTERTYKTRPPGSKTTQPSTLIARIRAAAEAKGEKLTLEEIARKIGASEKTARTYNGQSIIPIHGDKRDAIEQLARDYEVPVEEPTP